MRRTPNQRINREPITATIAAVGSFLGPAGSAAVLGAGAIGASQAIAARQEKKAAQAAANAQQNINQQNIKAAQGAEKEAQATANAQRRAALARRERTILTTPLGVATNPDQLNQPTILGVPG